MLHPLSATLLIASAAAIAQQPSAHTPAAAERDDLYTIAEPDPVKNGALQSGDVRDCRRDRSTRVAECRSRDGWRDVKRQLDRLSPPIEPETGGF